MRRPSFRNLARLTALASLAALPALGSACRAAPRADTGWPPLGSAKAPFQIDPELLPLPFGVGIPIYRNPVYSPLRPWHFYEELPPASLESGTLVPGVIGHHYPHVMVAGHYRGSGTYVYFLPRDGIFYLHGDDFAGHQDGMVGPFAGDPRLVLPKAGAEIPATRETEPDLQ